MEEGIEGYCCMSGRLSSNGVRSRRSSWGPQMVSFLKKFGDPMKRIWTWRGCSHHFFEKDLDVEGLFARMFEMDFCTKIEL